MAILLHPARATHHWIGPGVRRGERVYHVLSDLEGVEGRQELVAYVAPYGMRSGWIQYPGTYREHFDVPERVGLQMLAAGARPATNRDVGELLARKKRHISEQRLNAETAETAETAEGAEGGEEGAASESERRAGAD